MKKILIIIGIALLVVISFIAYQKYKEYKAYTDVVPLIKSTTMLVNNATLAFTGLGVIEMMKELDSIASKIENNKNEVNEMGYGGIKIYYMGSFYIDDCEIYVLSLKNSIEGTLMNAVKMNKISEFIKNEKEAYDAAEEIKLIIKEIETEQNKLKSEVVENGEKIKESYNNINSICKHDIPLDVLSIDKIASSRLLKN